MQRIRTAFACAVSAAGLFALAGPAPAAAPVTHQMGGQITFQAVLIPNPSLVKDPTCPLIGLNIGYGNVPPFGDVSFSSTECVSPNPFNSANLDASKGRLVLTTSSGDIINGTYSGTFVLNPATGTYVANAMPFNIIGGTGAYARARGAGTLYISQSAISGTGMIAPSGSVTY